MLKECWFHQITTNSSHKTRVHADKKAYIKTDGDLQQQQQNEQTQHPPQKAKRVLKITLDKENYKKEKRHADKKETTITCRL